MDRKPVFDVVRKLLGRGFTPAEVTMIDQALDRLLGSALGNALGDALASTEGGAPGTGMQLGAPARPERIGPGGVALIRTFEGCARKLHDGRFEAYPDPGTGDEPWTIGWGATHMSGRRVRPGDIISQAEADDLLLEHLASYADEVTQALGGTPTSEAQFDALVSFHYNTGAIARATLTKKHCAGDFDGAAREFGRWNRAGGR